MKINQDREEVSEVFDNDIVMYLSMFCEENDIANIKNESQSVWNAALRYIRKRVFSDPKILKSRNNIDIYNNKIPSNFNAYNYDLVNDVCNIYIDLCFLYDKEVSIVGFSNLTGIDDETIRLWGEEERLSKTSSEICKKLINFREESLSNKLVTGKQNPVGVLGVLNRHFAWNMPGVRQERKQITSETPEQIAARYGQKAIEGSTELPEVPE